MSSILIDYSKIVKDTKLRENLSSPPSSARGFNPGLILLISNEIYEKLTKFPYGKARLDFINSEEFIKEITDHFYIMYNSKRKICLLEPACEKYLPRILNSIFESLPVETILWVCIEIGIKKFNEIVETFISNGFANPYVTSLSPLYGDIPKGIALSRHNINDNNFDISIMNTVKYSIEQDKKNCDCCSIYAKLSMNAIKFLQETSKTGLVLEKEKQKELAGELFVKDVIFEDEKIVYIIDINKESVESGEEENVDVSPTRYNFHSHPHEAYVRHSVEKAWPSVTDYLGYLKLGNNTIFHCVATLEGVYIMSFTSYWAANIKQIKKSFVDKNYDISHKEPYTPEEYIEKINKIMYKNNPIFYLKFFPWEKADTIFQVNFATTNSACIASQKTMDIHEKIHD